MNENTLFIYIVLPCSIQTAADSGSVVQLLRLASLNVLLAVLRDLSLETVLGGARENRDTSGHSALMISKPKKDAEEITSELHFQVPLLPRRPHLRLAC